MFRSGVWILSRRIQCGRFYRIWLSSGRWPRRPRTRRSMQCFSCCARCWGWSRRAAYLRHMAPASPAAASPRHGRVVDHHPAHCGRMIERIPFLNPSLPPVVVADISYNDICRVSSGMRWQPKGDTAFDQLLEHGVIFIFISATFYVICGKNRNVGW